MDRADLPNAVKNVGDGVSAIAVLATLNDWLPPMAALVTLIWTFLRIIEWWEMRQERKAKKLMRGKLDN